MKDALTSLDLFHLVTELQCFVGARLEKVYQGEKERASGEKSGSRSARRGEKEAWDGRGDVTLQFRKKEAGKLLLRLKLPGILYQAEEKPAYGKMPGKFAMFLRKWLGNATLLSLTQRGFERIIEFSFQNKRGTFTLLAELLPPGNLLLLNEEGKIINLLQPQRHGQRVLRGGVLYEAPPPVFTTPAASREELVEQLVATTRDSLVAAIATGLSLGGTYAEEAVARAGVKGMPPSKEVLEKVAVAVKSLFEKGRANRHGDEVFPIVMKTKPPEEEFSSFSAAIESIVPEERVEVVKNERVARRERVLEQQQRQLEGFRKAAVENQRKGEVLYEQYQAVRDLLSFVNEVRATRGWKALAQALEEWQAHRSLPFHVTGWDEQRGTITIELEDANAVTGKDE